MRGIIIGNGEIGRSLQNVLMGAERPTVLLRYHTEKEPHHEAEILHIAFPYNEEFISEVRRYQEIYKPKYTVIHSTVPPGTSRECNAVHSPVIGIHPNLESGIKTFTKFLSGEQASEVADYFRRAGIKVYLFDKQETTELLKILDTTFYGVCVEYTKEVKRLADKHGIPFEAWSIWTDNYNTGYQKLGHPEFTRPNLVPIMKKVGGHCVLPNAHLVESPFTELVKKLNNDFKYCIVELDTDEQGNTTTRLEAHKINNKKCDNCGLTVSDSWIKKNITDNIFLSVDLKTGKMEFPKND